jgi:hypothetical protein
MAHVFVSYSRKDAPTVNLLADHLRKYGVNVWVDQQNLTVGDDWVASIQRAIASAISVVVVLSPNTASSEWVRTELEAARKFDKPILPVLIEGEAKDVTPFELKDKPLMRLNFDDNMAVKQLADALLNRVPS